MCLLSCEYHALRCTDEENESPKELPRITTSCTVDPICRPENLPAQHRLCKYIRVHPGSAGPRNPAPHPDPHATFSPCGVCLCQPVPALRMHVCWPMDPRDPRVSSGLLFFFSGGAVMIFLSLQTREVFLLSFRV